MLIIFMISIICLLICALTIVWNEVLEYLRSGHGHKFGHGFIYGYNICKKKMRTRACEDTEKNIN